jgi:hypothetical protein
VSYGALNVIGEELHDRSLGSGEFDAMRVACEFRSKEITRVIERLGSVEPSAVAGEFGVADKMQGRALPSNVAETIEPLPLVIVIRHATAVSGSENSGAPTGCFWLSSFWRLRIKVKDPVSGAGTIVGGRAFHEGEYLKFPAAVLTPPSILATMGPKIATL